MAASMWKVAHRFGYIHRSGITYSVLKRTLLSEAYKCQDVWDKRLDSPVLKQVKFSEFLIELHDKFEKEKQISLIDMDILANKLHKMEEFEVEMTENILHKFRHCQSAFPVRDSIVHAIVRAYIDLNMTDRLLVMMRDKHGYGLFPDYYVANILMDHLVKQGNIRDGVKVAYEMMMQEDFSHPVTRMMSLFVCTKYLFSSDRPATAELELVDDSGEEQWVAIKIVPQPFYDDHFDIKEDNFLLGKTLYMLGETVDNCIGRSLSLMGLGLYQKFSKAITLLENWTSTEMPTVVTHESLDMFSNSLEATQTRDPNEKVKEFGFRTVADEIRLLLPTSDEKEKYQKQFQELAEKLKSDGKISTDNVEAAVNSMVPEEIQKHVTNDTSALTELMHTWTAERTDMLDVQLQQYLIKEKEDAIAEKLIDLWEKEEILTFFEKSNEIKLAQLKAPKERIAAAKEDDDDEDDIPVQTKKRR